MKISEENIIKESVLLDRIPDDVIDIIMDNKTSLGNNPAIPDIFDIPFLLKTANERFSDVKNALEEIGIENLENSDIKTLLSKLINECMELERPYKDELEKICFNIIVDLLSVPNDSVNLEIELVDKVELNDESIITEPIDGNSNFEFNDICDAMSIKKEVMKRRLLDSLCMGAALTISSNIELYDEEISEINPELCNLYKKIISLNNYLLYTVEDIGINDKDKKQLGTVVINLGAEDEVPRIHSQGILFPIILCETLRGFFELFISHGLPNNKEKAELIIRKSDYLKAEPWDMRIGPSLWILLSKSFNDITYKELPYVIKKIACLDTNKFNFLMKEVFAKTKKGKTIMSRLCGSAKNDLEYDKFSDKMDKLKTDKSTITDEYIGADEL